MKDTLVALVPLCCLASGIALEIGHRDNDMFATVFGLILSFGATVYMCYYISECKKPLQKEEVSDDSV